MPSKISFSLKWVWLLLVSLVSLAPCFLLLTLIMTSIRDYFKPSCSTTTLPDPDGPLKEEIRPSTIRDVNKIVSPLIGSAAVQTSSWFVIMSEFIIFFCQNGDFSGFVKILCRQQYSLYSSYCPLNGQSDSRI